MNNNNILRALLINETDWFTLTELQDQLDLENDVIIIEDDEVILIDDTIIISDSEDDIMTIEDVDLDADVIINDAPVSEEDNVRDDAIVSGEDMEDFSSIEDDDSSESGNKYLKKMNISILPETLKQLKNIRKTVSEIENNDEINYGKICEINNKCDITEEEWKVKKTVLNFSSKLDNIESKYEVITEKVNRDVVKIFLFGKVSVGKSKLLNAMLGDNYFASATAHTTSSFVHVKKSEDDSYRIKTKDTDRTFTDKTKFIEEIERISGNIKGNKATANETIEVSICMDDETLLKKGIEIVDCPGSGNKSQITDCIKKNSQEADIFIFVLNYALTDDDRVFFKYQEDSSTKPDVFIVINQWDESDNDDEESTQMSKTKIKEECSKFLRKLEITKEDEIYDRIYFLSAREMSQIRIENNDSLVDSDPNVKKRFEDFMRFEYNLKKYINDPQDNKTRRYMQEIKNIQDFLNTEFMKFQADIFNEKNNSLIPKYEKWMKDMENFKATILSKNDDVQNSLLKRLEDIHNEIIHSPDLRSSEWVTSQLEHFTSEMKLKLQEAQLKQYKDFIHFIKTKDLINRKTYLSETKELNIKLMWNPIIVNPTDNVSKEACIVKEVMEKLAMIPIPNIPFQMFAQGVSLVGKLVIKRIEDSESEQHRQSIIQQLNSQRSNMSRIIEENVNEIKEYYMEKANEIIQLFQEKSKLFNEYWRRLEGILKDFDKDGFS